MQCELLVVRIEFSKQSAFDLIAVDGPVGIGMFFTAVKFEVWSGADLFNQSSEQKRLPAVSRTSCDMPTPALTISKWQVAAHPEQQKFVRNSPVVSHAKLWLNPQQTRLVFKAPCFNDLERFSEEAICSPKMEMCICGCQLFNRLVANSI